MKSHKGRLIDHVVIRVKDLEASKRFYRAIFDALGIPFGTEGEGWFWKDELFVIQEDPPTQGLHLAFQAPDRETVHRFYNAALVAGGTNNGEPEEQPYHPGYFGAFVFDPDRNNIEAVYHGPSERSAQSVIFTSDHQI